MKKPILGLFTVFCIVNLSACFSAWEGDSSEGSLTVNLGTSARSIFYDIDDDKVEDFSHVVSLLNADGKTVIDQQPFSGSVTINVPSGAYTVKVKGFSVDTHNEQTLRSYGKEPAEVVSGKNTPVSIKMYSAVEADGNNWSKLSLLNSDANSGRTLYVFITDDDFAVDTPINIISGNVILIAESEAKISMDGDGSIFGIADDATLQLGVKDMAGTITFTGSGNNTAPLINVNGGTLEMDRVTISGNNNSGGNGGGVSVTSDGTLRILTGTIYGLDEDDTNLRNTSATGAALHNNGGTVEYGTFSGEQWNGKGLDTSDNTIEVMNGVLIRGGNIPVTNIILTPSELSLPVGGTGTLNLIVAPGDATNKSVSWFTSNSSVATINNGTVTAGLTAGTATITVASVENPALRATSIITVRIPEPGEIAVTGITLDKDKLSLTVGDEPVTLTATVVPSDASNQTVTWVSDSPGVATVVDGGLVTAITAGTATITVTTEDGGFMAKCTVSVTSPITSPGTAIFDIRFAQIADDAAGDIIVHEKISLSGNNGQTEITLAVEDDLYDSIIWYIPAINVTIEGTSITLNSANPPYNKVGEYYLTLEVWKDGVPYNKTVIFTVIP